jgi:exopolyphosphatase/guanosine-5'-triphosphate,3'-diphosphate pyrophosphatase
VRVAAIDLGTNSFLCLVADVENGKIKTVLEDVTHLVRIGEKVHETRTLQPQALERAARSFAEFEGIIRRHGCERVLAVATSAARDVKNSAELIALGQKHGIPIRVISGAQEAMLTFTGMAVGREDLDGVVGIDIGGGSTEIIGKNGGEISGKSVDIGCVRLTELFVTANPVPNPDLTKLWDYAREKLSVFPRMNPREAIAVAGTPTALACVEKNIPFNAEAVHGTVLSRKTISLWAERLAALSVEDRLKLPGLDRGRADVIVAGAVILDLVGETIGADQFTVSVLGARYGLALAMEKGEIS